MLTLEYFQCRNISYNNLRVTLYCSFVQNIHYQRIDSRCPADQLESTKSQLEPSTQTRVLKPLKLSPHAHHNLPVRRIVGLPEEEDARAKGRHGDVKAAVSPVAEMFRPVGLLLHSQSVPCFGNYENVSHLDVPKTLTSTIGESRATRRPPPVGPNNLRKREYLNVLQSVLNIDWNELIFYILI